MEKYQKLMQRERELAEKYPELKELIHEDPLVHAWFQRHIRTDESIEKSFLLLIKELVKSKKAIEREYTKHLEVYGA